MKIENILNEIHLIKTKELIQIGLIILFLNNLFIFTVGLYIGYIFGNIVNTQVYEEKLIMHDFNITKACAFNDSKNMRLGIYNDEVYNQLEKYGEMERNYTCVKSYENMNHLAQ